MAPAYNPRPLVLVTLRGNASVLGRTGLAEDILALTWHAPVSQEPAQYLIVLSKKYGFSINLLRSGRVFAVHFIPMGLEKAAHFSAHHAGEFLDKFRDTGLTKGEAVKIDCPVIQEAVSCLECELIQEIDFGDHIGFVGKVVNAVVRDAKAKKLFHIEGDKFTTTLDT